VLESDIHVCDICDVFFHAEQCINCEVFKIKIALSVCRRKSSSKRNDAENERTETASNTNGDNAGSSQDFGNGVPLVDMPYEPVNMGSEPEHRTPPHTHIGSAPAPPIYAVIQRDPSANAAVQSEASAPTAGDFTNPPILYQELTLVEK